jgi:hypothetical protein
MVSEKHGCILCPEGACCWSRAGSCGSTCSATHHPYAQPLCQYTPCLHDTGDTRAPLYHCCCRGPRAVRSAAAPHPLHRLDVGQQAKDPLHPAPTACS